MKSVTNLFHLFLLLFITIPCLGQNLSPDKKTEFRHPYLTGQNEIDITVYKPNSDTTVYQAVHTIFSLMEPISHLSWIASYDRTLDDLPRLMEGEGNNAFLESNIYVPWTILRGRDMSSDFQQASRVTFNYWGQIRVGDDSSSPILPPTNSIGLSWDYSHSDSFRGGFLFGRRKYRENCSNRNFWKGQDSSVYRVFTSQLTIMHYSNGQPDGFFVDSTNTRHDYLNGDFSTNYVQAMLGYHWAWPKGDIFSVYGGYRRDMELAAGFLQFVPEQENSYGKNRVLLNFQYITKPFSLWTIKRTAKCADARGRTRRYLFKEFFSLQFRTEITYIADSNLSNWRQADRDKKHAYRWGIKNYVKLNILRNRNIGWVLQHFYGRDYHNIRFDNVVHIFQIGLNFKFHKNPILSFPNQKYELLD